MPVLDTNYLIALDDHDPGAETLHAELGASAILPSIVAAEYLTGAGRHQLDDLDRLARTFRLVHTDVAWLTAAAALRRKAFDLKRPARAADAWIAAWAIVHQTYVVTRNVKDFEALGVPAKSW